MEDFFESLKNELQEEITKLENEVDQERHESKLNELRDNLKVVEYEEMRQQVKVRQDRVDELEVQINMQDFGYDLTEEQIRNHIERSEHEVSVLKAEIERLKESMESLRSSISFDDYDFDKVVSQINKRKQLFEIDSALKKLREELDELEEKYKDGGLIPLKDQQRREQLKDLIDKLENKKDELEGRSRTNPSGPTGPEPTGPTGPAPTAPTGPAPTAPTGPAPTAPTGPAPTAPTGPAPTAPTGPEPTAPTGPGRGTNKVSRVKAVKKWLNKNKKKILIIAGIAVVGVAAIALLNAMLPAMAANMMISNSALWPTVNATTQGLLHANNIALSSTVAKATGTIANFSNAGVWSFGGTELAAVAGDLAAKAIAAVPAATAGIISGLGLTGVGVALSDKKERKSNYVIYLERLRSLINENERSYPNDRYYVELVKLLNKINKDDTLLDEERRDLNEQLQYLGKAVEDEMIEGRGGRGV